MPITRLRYKNQEGQHSSLFYKRLGETDIKQKYPRHSCILSPGNSVKAAT